MNERLMMGLRLLAISGGLAACGDNSLEGGGGAGGAFSFEGVSPTCKRWCEAFAPCSGGSPMADCVDLCDLTPGCEAEQEDHMTCQVDYWAHSCSDPSEGCFPTAMAYHTCLYRQADCTIRANSCSCAGNVYTQDLLTRCQIVGAGGVGHGGEAEGGAAGGGTALGVECQCVVGGQLDSVCEQTTLECSLVTNCCNFGSF